MKSVGFALWGSALALLILAAFKSSLIWVAAPLLGAALSYALLRSCLYRPPEDHLGVIFKFGRFSRLISPDLWVLAIPVVHEIRDPISLRPHQVEVSMTGLLSQEQVPIDCEFLAYYQTDLRLASAHFRSQALHISEEGWNSIIRTMLRETAGEVIGGANFQQLLTLEGRAHLKQALSALLAQRVQGFGLRVNPETGVSIQVLKPAETVIRAVVDRFVAETLGEAALARIRPLFKEIGQHHPELAWDALLLERVAAGTREARFPLVVITPSVGSIRRERAREAIPAVLQATLEEEDEQEPVGRRRLKLPHGETMESAGMVP